MARKYRVTVNGKAYDVDVEEMGVGTPAAAPGHATAIINSHSTAAPNSESPVGPIWLLAKPSHRAKARLGP